MSDNRRSLASEQRLYGLAHTPLRAPARLLKSESVASNGLLADVRTRIEFGKSRERTRVTALDVLQFKAYGARLDGSNWKCKIYPGFVRSINPDSDATEVVKDWMPTLGGTALNAGTPPELTIATGKTIYCRVITTAKGVVDATPTIVAETTPENGVHFQPPSVTGELYLPIANVSIVDDVVTFTQIQQGGPIEVIPNLPELKNVGGARELIIGRVSAGDTYDVRTLEQLTEGEGVAIIRPLEAEETEGDTIPFRCVLKDNSGSTPYTITGEGAAIKFKMTGATGTYSDPFNGLIEIIDGLISSFTSSDGVGADLNLTIKQLQYNGDGQIYGSETTLNVLYWRKGIYVGNVDPEDENEAINVTVHYLVSAA